MWFSMYESKAAIANKRTCLTQKLRRYSWSAPAPTACRAKSTLFTEMADLRNWEQITRSFTRFRKLAAELTARRCYQCWVSSGFRRIYFSSKFIRYLQKRWVDGFDNPVWIQHVSVHEMHNGRKCFRSHVGQSDLCYFTSGRSILNNKLPNDGWTRCRDDRVAWKRLFLGAYDNFNIASVVLLE